MSKMLIVVLLICLKRSSACTYLRSRRMTLTPQCRMKALALKKKAKMKTTTDSSALISHPRSCVKLHLLRNQFPQKLPPLLIKMIMKLMKKEPLLKKRARFKSRLQKTRTVEKKMIFSEIAYL